MRRTIGAGLRGGSGEEAAVALDGHAVVEFLQGGHIESVLDNID